MVIQKKNCYNIFLSDQKTLQGLKAIAYSIQNGFKKKPEDVIDIFIKKSYDKNDIKHPFINIISEDGMDVFFVIVMNWRYRVPSLLKAIDILYKCVYTFNLQYPKQASHIFTSIERHFLKMNVTNYDNKSIIRLVKTLPQF